jgi:hypothetical protein
VAASLLIFAKVIQAASGPECSSGFMSSKVPARKAALDGDWSLDASSRSTWGPLIVNQRRSAAAAKAFFSHA